METILGKTKLAFSLASKKVRWPAALMVLSCLGFLLLHLSPAHGAGTVTENFTGSQFDTDLWDAWSMGEGTAGQVVNERMEVTVSGSGYAGLASGFTLEGDFAIQVDFTLLNWPAANGTQLTMGLYDRSNGGFFHVGRANTGSSEQYFLFVTDGITDDSGVAEPVLSGTLKMTRTGQTMEGFYWDGASWQSIGSATDARLGARVGVQLSIGPYGGTYSGVSAQAAFDTIRVDYSILKPDFFGQANPLPAIAPLLLD